MFDKKPEPINFDLLSSLLQSQLAQSSLFNPPTYTKDRNQQDAKNIANFTQSGAYRAWAGEAWVEVIANLKKILVSKDQRELDQAVGGLRSTLNLLGVSFQAWKSLEKAKTETQPSTSNGR